MTSQPKFQEMQKTANTAFKNPPLEIFLPGEPGYPTAKQITNTLFNSIEPGAVAYAQSTEQVQWLVKFCRKNQIGIRMRSGGHHHEGMCSANGVLMIRMSKMNSMQVITTAQGTSELLLESGAKLEDVYKFLLNDHLVLPGGGCRHVNAGGLTLGGGYGLYVRKGGLTMDNVKSLEMVNEKGAMITASPQENADLFNAIRGAGGGNFGIVTRFHFKLIPFEKVATYKLYWKETHMAAIVKKWLEVRQKFPDELSTGIRLMVAPSSEGTKFNWRKAPVYLFARIFGTGSELIKQLKPLTDAFPPDATYGPTNLASKKQLKQFGLAGNDALVGNTADDPLEELFPVELLEEHFPGQTLVLEDLIDSPKNEVIPLQFGEPVEKDLSPRDEERKAIKIDDLFTLFEAYDDWDLPILLGEDTHHGGDLAETGGEKSNALDPPKDNCLGNHPRKVTSAYPKGNAASPELIDAVSDYILKTEYDPQVKAYMSFYGMGGASARIAPSATGYVFRNKDVLMQFQTWWNASLKGPITEQYIQWVKDFRKQLEPHIEGAFINFVDRDLPPYPGESDPLKGLLRHYYLDNLEQLMAMRKKYAPSGIFDFEMRIPTE